ncbi:MAG: DUF4375 domain-containing protein [Verrucomicrobiota bacterium]
MVIIALMGLTAAVAGLLVMNAPGSSASHLHLLFARISLIGGTLSVVGAVGMLLRKSFAYCLAIAGLVMIAVLKVAAIFTVGFQWKSSVWAALALFLALEAVARVLGWLEDDEAPQVEGNSIVHDYLNASMSAKHALEKMVRESPSQAVRNLTSALTSNKDQIRSGAARMLAAMGSASALPGTLKALASDDYFVRGGAIGGIKTAMEATPDDVFRRGVFDPLAAFLSTKTAGGMLHTEVPSLLLTLDRKQAESILISESVLTLDSEWLPAILDALTAGAALPPLETIRRLLSDLESGMFEFWHPELAHAAILRALMAIRAPEAEETLRRVIKEKPTLADKASRMLLELHGIDPMDVYLRLLDRVEGSGIESLAEVEQNFYAVMVFTAECDNGGIQQYFTNTSSEHARQAFRALQVIDAPNAADFLRKVMMLFGKQGPPEDRDERLRRIDLMAPDFFEEADRIQGEAKADERGLETLLNFYLLENVNSFS